MGRINLYVIKNARTCFTSGNMFALHCTPMDLSCVSPMSHSCPLFREENLPVKSKVDTKDSSGIIYSEKLHLDSATFDKLRIH